MTCRKRRLGLLGPKRTTITVHRSEEIIPEHGGTLTRGFSSASSDGEPLSGSIIGEDKYSLLYTGQLVGRQVLGSPVLGDIQLSLIDRRGNLELEVIRARGLQTKAGSKLLPAPWVKVYLVSGKKCLAKAKTSQARRTLDPLFQQQLIFSQRYGGCVLQVTIWGDYGRVEGAKVFMGVAQILLDNLDLSELVIGWYKLFGTSSLVSVPPGGGKDSALQDNSKTEIQNQVSEESISVSGT
ncbi:regulating synaptic membrane exocytosis protein 3-like [Eurytemora carolleeae]|uniref:regulating synaptic membrane exocytosis protein 3-like n=1 Tax=Eurytemora carolleeae TaxID=1294199 RepID=UPI000C76D012|nr:regulating synaptic membrane exocytosis protein 3-like [Eurytemora carolleeae]|eukprot:XP_023346569.1 regulating synaptic membrane exocytosis protein 3-like [Eurytemora affinis]